MEVRLSSLIFSVFSQPRQADYTRLGHYGQRDPRCRPSAPAWADCYFIRLARRFRLWRCPAMHAVRLADGKIDNRPHKVQEKDHQEPENLLVGVPHVNQRVNEHPQPKNAGGNSESEKNDYQYGGAAEH